eukprot:scaffold254116_cov14-Tisochrysis_lutea.AAC.1
MLLAAEGHTREGAVKMGGKCLHGGVVGGQRIEIDKMDMEFMLVRTKSDLWARVLELPCS